MKTVTPVRVVVVDDSALIRSVLTTLINRSPDLQVVGAACNPYEAREIIRERDPDVITLDVEMPRMNGLEFLEKLMRLRPMPVVMISTLTERGARTTLQALELGAIDFIAKPVLPAGAGAAAALGALAEEITQKIRIAASARITRHPAGAGMGLSIGAASSGASGVSPARPGGGAPPARQVLAIGASTGGTEAIREVLCALPADFPAIVITQHMPAGFTTSFAARLDSLCQVRVREAVHNERLLQGHAYLAPGGRHLAIGSAGAGWVTQVLDTEPVNRHRPSVDVLFRSVARVAGPRAAGLMLTGMGGDGAAAMRVMKDSGSFNLVQDEASCVVFGMPREAIAAGAAHEVLPLSSLARRLVTHFSETGRGTPAAPAPGLPAPARY